MLFRFYRGLRKFLSKPLTFAEAEQFLLAYKESRERSFLDQLSRAVFQNLNSPWLKIFVSAGVQLRDVQDMVLTSGLESALQSLYDAGVYCTILESKGKQPIVRNGIEIPCNPEDFNNPSVRGSFESITGGSSGTPRKLLIDFALLDHDVTAQRAFLRSFQLENRPTAIWRPVPPGGAGLKRVLLQEKCNVPAQHWFSQTDPSVSTIPLKSWVFLKTAAFGARSRFPDPEFVSLENASVVAEWLAAAVRDGSPAHLDTMVSSAVRVCQAALARGLDISGTFFRVGSESLTASRAAVIARAGASVACHYSMSETGPIGMACADASHIDDVHLLEGKLAAIARPGAAGESALFLTTLIAGTPRIMINVESGDSAVIEKRKCNCVFGALGYETHLHGIRSYEKVSAEGMYYLGADLASLVEDFLPSRFGGAPTDYQFVHEESNSLNRIRLIIAPSVGPLNESSVGQSVFAHLAATSRGDWMKSKIWQDALALKIERAMPQATVGHKILPVRFVRD